MPEMLTRFWKQAVEFWKGLEKTQKTRLYVTSSIVIVAVVIGILLMTRPNVITLITSDDPKQISDMSTALSDDKIWNTMDDTGTSILVNARDKSKAKLSLYKKGLPKEGTTFADAISMIGITTTDSDKEHIWQEQQKSEIEQNIEQLDNIENASVNLAVPEQSVFITDGQQPTQPQAIVTVKSMQQLTPEQVHGIILIVTGSVVGLDPKNVSVVDADTGMPLNDNTANGDLSTVSNQEEMKLAMEKELKAKVMEQLGLGQTDSFDTLTVMPNVVLDFNTDQTQLKTLGIPQGMSGGAVISSDTKDETVKNGNTSGIPGQTSNPVGTANAPSYQTGTTGNGDYTDKEDKINYGYDETVSNQEKATGQMIPDQSTMAISLWYGRKVPDTSKLTAAFITGIQQIASNATGIPVNNITVNELKFAPEVAVQTPISDVIKQMVSDYGVFALMLFLIIGFLIMARPAKRKKESEAVGQLAAAGASGPKFVVPDTGEPVPEIDLEEKSEIKKQIEKFVKQKPDSVAQLLRNWLSDEWDG